VIIVSESTLASFRAYRTCEWCLKLGPCYPHHIIPRGHGGGRRLDVRLNLVSLGHDFVCGCHKAIHDKGEPSREDLWGVVGRREKCNPAHIEGALWWVLRADKDWSKERLVKELKALEPGERKLAKAIIAGMARGGEGK